MRYISEQKPFDDAIAEMRSQQVIALDTEADSLHSYFDKVCLIQISTKSEDFIIDPLGSIDLAGLGEVLADRNVRKILHGADYDLRILSRDFGFHLHNLVDTMICAQLLGYESFGLAALLSRHFGLEVNKAHQRANWAMRPLTPPMLEYAATDTHYLIALAELLQQQLEERERWEWALEEFARLETVRPRDSEPDPDAYKKIRGATKLVPRQLAALALLHQWRDGLAQKRDVPPFRVLSNEILVGLSSALPESRHELSLISGMSPPLVQRYAPDLLARMNQVRELREDELPERATGKQWIRDRDLERRVDQLKRVRDHIASSLGIDPSLLAPRHVLAAIATAMPKTVDELESIPAMRSWQRSVAGQALVNALHGRG